MKWWGIVLLLFLLSPVNALAEIVINEFSSSSNPEWIELYNSGGSAVDITGWKIIDLANHSEILTGSIGSGGYFVFERPEGWLNNGGDTFTLFNNVSPVEQIDQVVYGSGGVVSAPA